MTQRHLHFYYIYSCTVLMAESFAFSILTLLVGRWKGCLVSCIEKLIICKDCLYGNPVQLGITPKKKAG